MAKTKNLGLAKLQVPVTALDGQGKGGKLSVALPPSPTSTCTIGPSSPRDQDEDKDEADTWSVQSHTPTFESMQSGMGPATPVNDDLANRRDVAEGIVPDGVLAIAQLQASMKEALQGLANVMDHVGKQSVLMSQLASQIKERNELSTLQYDLQQQIAKQKEDLDSLKVGLETRIKQAAEDTIKTELRTMVKESIANVVEGKVREELSKQIPESLRQRGMGHERQINEVQTELHNSEARRYNSSLKSASLDAPLRPLLRPVPTPEQSPYPVVLTSPAEFDSSPALYLPYSELLRPPVNTQANGPASTRPPSALPSAISRSTSLQMAATTPAPSALFPKDLKSLFSLDPSATRTLLKEYGLQSAAPSPLIEETIYTFQAPKLPEPPFSSPASLKPTSPVEEESESEEEIRSHMEDMNTFMTHIGVPFKMVPPPKEKETNAERRKKLTPLIISNWTGPR